MIPSAVETTKAYTYSSVTIISEQPLFKYGFT
jgi:hypothetical protein